MHVQIRRLTEQWRGVQSVKELHISHTSGLLGASRTLHVQFKCEHPVSALFNRFNFYVLNGPSQIFEASTFLFSPRSTLIDYWTTSLRIFVHLNVVLQASQDLSIQKSTKGPWHGGHLASNSDWLEYLDLTTHMTARKCVFCGRKRVVGGVLDRSVLMGGHCRGPGCAPGTRHGP